MLISSGSHMDARKKQSRSSSVLSQSAFLAEGRRGVKGKKENYRVAAK